MPLRILTAAKRTFCAVFFILCVNGCSGSYDETVAGITVPVPSGMKKSEGDRVEISLPGFGGGQASFQGKTDPDEVIKFYKKEMPQRGWSPSASVVSRGGMLAYAKEGKSILITVGKSEGTTTLTITVGGTGR